MRSSIDIGSNSTLLLIARVDGKGVVEEIREESRVTGLGRGVDKQGQFLDETMEETFKALSDYVDILKKYDLEPCSCLVTATEASRNASNAKSFFLKVKSELDLDVQIISAAGEAYYTGIGVACDEKIRGHERFTVMDIGGSSTEFIKLKSNGRKIEKSISLPVGAVRASEWINEDLFNSKVIELFKSFDLADYHTKEIVCVAGSMTSIVAMMKGFTAFKAREINGIEISIFEFCQFVEKIEDLGSEVILRDYPFLGKRSATIVAGARLARVLFNELGVETLSVSTRGLRHGTLKEGKIDISFLV